MDALPGALPLLIEGFWITLAVALLSLALATLLGALTAAAKLAGGRIARGVAEVYTTVIRGVPDLVMILLVYFAGQRLLNEALAAFGLGPVTVTEFAAGVVAIGLSYGAYMGETFRAAYRAIPHGQIEAAQAFGLSRGRTLRRVVAPQLARHALPGFGNIWQVLVKATAVVSVIGLEDLVGLADKIGKRERDPFTFLMVVMAAYLLITSLSGWALRRAERRVARGH